MLLQVLFWLVLGALILKVTANLLVPYRVLRLGEEEGISVVFLLLGDVFLSALAMSTAWWIDKPDSLYAVNYVALGVAIGVLGSYVHYFSVLMIHAWLQRFKKPQ